MGQFKRKEPCSICGGEVGSLDINYLMGSSALTVGVSVPIIFQIPDI